MKNTTDSIFCTAPWLHSFLVPSGSYRICCHSSYPHDHDDTDFETFWNGERIRRVRKQILSGEIPKECSRCASSQFSLETHSHYFATEYKDLIPQIQSSTSSDGHTTMMPIDFDYRLSNICNLKCRMCSELYSSSLAEESKSGIYSEMSDKQSEDAKNKMMTALLEGRTRRVYWGGGEPLLSSFHWKYMDAAIQNNFAKEITCFYNSNLSTLTYKEKHLYSDVLKHFKSVWIGCSMDAYGNHAEYLRTGINWENWKKNILDLRNLVAQNKDHHLTIEATVTLPGLFSLGKLINFAVENKILINLNLVDDGTSLKLLSPLALPKELLHPLLKIFVPKFSQRCPPTLWAR